MVVFMHAPKKYALLKSDERRLAVCPFLLDGECNYCESMGNKCGLNCNSPPGAPPSRYGVLCTVKNLLLS